MSGSSSCAHRNRHGTGDERPGTIPADIVFVINEKKHPVFEREGNDLIHTAKLPLVDALCGATIKVTTLDSRPLTVCAKPPSNLSFITQSCLI